MTFRLAVSKSGAAGIAAQPFSSSAPRGAGAAAATAAAAASAETTDIAAALVPAPAKAPVREDWVTVTSPSVGVFYRRPAPDQPPFVDLDSVVAAGDPVCLIEVMKMFAGVAAPHAGRIVAIAVEDASMVEYGQPLMYIEPT